MPFSSYAIIAAYHTSRIHTYVMSYQQNWLCPNITVNFIYIYTKCMYIYCAVCTFCHSEVTSHIGHWPQFCRNSFVLTLFMLLCHSPFSICLLSGGIAHRWGVGKRSWLLSFRFLFIQIVNMLLRFGKHRIYNI